MSTFPIIHPDPPPPPPPPPPSPPRAPAAPRKVLGIFPATADAHLWRRKWSTWLVGAAVALDAAAAYFVAAPVEWRTAFPPSTGLTLLLIGMGIKGLIPLATSIQQKAPQS